VPHLTVAAGEGAVLDEAEREVAAGLPLTAQIRALAAYEEIGDLWSRRALLPLG
jgi:hypothetical protein